MLRIFTLDNFRLLPPHLSSAPTVVVPSDKQRQNYQGSLKRKRQPEEGPTDRDRPIRDPAPVPTEVSVVVPSDKQKHHRRTFLKPEGSNKHPKAESEPTDRGLIRSPIANFNPKKFARLLETRLKKKIGHVHDRYEGECFPCDF
ncbi:hypothetical protein BC936DRAFT_149409 [Jimgerdemannia flammicorona]|uniref:Uncharacterized protein n=1 Tax=Jimgerdemannia flammicorona TaxID=994334 RepID=A0A433D0X1_9FUNG|nr:hypothetical protein BC936DRAFT_149409 [Jimgerdemannia flammicorona]